MPIWLLITVVFNAWAAPKKIPVESYTAHPFQCRSCHEPQHDFWEKTHHASAFVTLFHKGQHFDPECISCHSLGFRQPGGYAKVRDGIQGKVSSIDLVSEMEPRTDELPKLRERFHAKVHDFEKDGKIQKNFWGIQCEHCHGLRGEHPGGAKSKKVSVATCKTCHTQERSPRFGADWVAKVTCPPLQKK